MSRPESVSKGGAVVKLSRLRDVLAKLPPDLGSIEATLILHLPDGDFEISQDEHEPQGCIEENV